MMLNDNYGITEDIYELFQLRIACLLHKIQIWYYSNKN
jgi:hypothetical protein